MYRIIHKVVNPFSYKGFGLVSWLCFLVLFLCALFAMPEARAERDFRGHTVMHSAPVKTVVQHTKKVKKVKKKRKHGKAPVLVAKQRKGGTVIGKTRGLNPRLMTRLYTISRAYGQPVLVTSGCRTARTNHGVRNSYHLTRRGCKAADIQIKGVSASNLFAHIRKYGGGSGRYCGRNFVHTDVGPTRQWYWYCGGKRKKGRRR